MGKYDRSSSLLTEEEDQRVRYATRRIVRYGPRKEKIQQSKAPRGADLPLSGSLSNQGNGTARASPIAGQPPEFLGRRLRLEHTFVQANENALEAAATLLSSARRMPTTFASRAAAILKAANYSNEVQRQLGTSDSQLQSVLVGTGADVQENGHWSDFKHGFLSPTRVLKAMTASSDLSPGEGQSFSFTLGPWAGKEYNVAQLIDLIKGVNWVMMITPVFIGFLELSYELIDKVDSGNVFGAELDEAELQLAHLINDYWGLNLVLTFHEYVDNLPELCVPYLPSHVALQPLDFHSMAVKMGVTADQLDQCMLLRRHAQNCTAKLATSAGCVQDILDELIAQTPDSDINSEILQAVEAMRQNQLSKRALEVEVVHKLLFAILDPIQTAKFLTWIRKIVVLPICQWKEWMRLIYPCILGADSWMEWYTPFDATPLMPVASLSPLLTTGALSG